MANEFKIKKGLIVTGASGGTVVDIQGSQGQLFSVTDDLSGSIFAVSDISGVPILDVNSSGAVNVDGTLNINNKVVIQTGTTYAQATDYLYIGGNDLGSGDAAIYLGNRGDGTGYGWRFYYAGIGSGNNNNLVIRSENLVSPVDAVTFNQDGFATFANKVRAVNWFQGASATNTLYSAGSTGLLLQTAGSTEDDNDSKIFFRNSGMTVKHTFNTHNGDATFVGQGFSAATSSGDASSTLTTKGYVDSLITGATIYRGAWDPSGGGYGSPDLSGVTQTSGYYYICSAAGTAEPNGTGTEPDTWAVGDWVIYNDVSGTGQWQKIDNSSVLSGVGTGQTVALWEGAGSVTDSETLGNAPITVSGNNTTFAGNATASNFYGLAQDLAVTSNDTFNGTYSLLWHDGADVYSSTWMTVTGSNDTLTVPTIAADLNGTINTATTGTTQTAGNNSTLIATTAYADAAAAAVPIGNYLPLSAGSSYPLTGDLYIEGADKALRINNGTQPVVYLGDGGANTDGQLLLYNSTGGVNVVFNGDNQNHYITNGNVGIGTTNPTQKLHVAGKLLVDNGDLGSVAGDAIYHAEITGARHHLDFKEVRTADASDWKNTTYKLQMRVDSTNHQSIDFVSDASYNEHIDIYTGNQVFNTRFAHDGNVGIGTASPDSILEIVGDDPILTIRDSSTGLSAANATLRLAESGSSNTLDNYWDLKMKPELVGGTTNFAIANNSLGEVLNINYQGNVGIGTTTPNAKLDVQGTQGQLFSVTDDLSGDIFSVADISGVPIMNVNSDGTSYFDGNVCIGTTTPFTTGGTANLTVAGNRISWGASNTDMSYFRRLGAGEFQWQTYNSGNTGEIHLQPYGGNVGIGTTSPIHPLYVAGDIGQTDGSRIWFRGSSSSSTTGAQSYIYSNGLNLQIKGDDNVQILGDGGGLIAHFDYTGNVGIGTTSPGAKLEVNGNIKLSSTAGQTATPSNIWLGNDYSNGTTRDKLKIYLYNSGTEQYGFTVGNQSDIQYHSNQEHDFYVANSLKVRINQSGNVGIGTDSPGKKLHVHSSSGDGVIRVSGDNILNSGGEIKGFNNGFAFNVAPSGGGTYVERMRINGLGNVGIGTTSPSDTLEVEGGVTITSETPTKLLLNNTKNGSWTQGEALGLVEFYGNDASGGGAKVQSSIEVVSQDQYGAHFNMTFNLSKGSGGNAELMRLTGEGRLGIGTAGPLATLHVDNNQTSNGTIGIMSDAAAGGTGTRNIHINLPEYGEGIRFLRSGTYSGGAMKFYSGSSNVGSVQINASSTSFNTTSDYRAKENVVPMENSINRLKELKPCRFNFLIDPENTVDGFIAHEAQEVVPEAITGEKDELDYEGNPQYQGIDQSKLVPLLTSALQEAISKIEQLETRIQTLENN